MREQSKKNEDAILTSSRGSGRSADMFTTEVRSRIMRAVKGRDTTAEARLGAVLGAFRLSFKAQAENLPGCPDFIQERLRVAVFVDGDFWHGRWWRRGGRLPVSNRAYWIRKL